MAKHDEPVGGADGPKKVENQDGPAEQHAQAVTDDMSDRGLRGVEVDPTPNDNYTVGGVLSGAPTPETDPDHAEWVRKQQRDAPGSSR